MQLPGRAYVIVLKQHDRPLLTTADALFSGPNCVYPLLIVVTFALLL